MRKTLTQILEERQVRQLMNDVDGRYQKANQMADRLQPLHPDMSHNELARIVNDLMMFADIVVKA